MLGSLFINWGTCNFDLLEILNVLLYLLIEYVQ